MKINIIFYLMMMNDLYLQLTNNQQDVAIKISGKNSFLKAKEIANKYGYTKVSKIGNLDDYYSLEKKVINGRVKRNSDDIFLDKDIEWIETQYPKKRSKRDLLTIYPQLNTNNPVFNDPLFSEQWYLDDMRSEQKLDINVVPVWNKGFSGTGVVVTILDDGIEHNHSDLARNYDPNASWDINDEDPDPFPRYDIHDENKHGTRCAGEVSAAANNGICGVGVAFNSRIGGVRMLDGHVTDKVEAASLSLNPQYIDIYSSSWGPNDDGKTVEGPGTLARAALINGIKKGRNGLGSIYVWASGNGGHHSDDCNCDGYANSIYTLSISSASDQGDVPWYSETCASTFASTLSSGTHLQRRIITTDLHNTCTNNHTGTSASAPIAAGIFALLLESNRNLTWRDVQHLTVYTSNSMSLIKAGNWSKNSVGLNFHSKFGYGILDTNKLIEWATEKDWETSPPMFSCYIPSQEESNILSPQGEISINFFVDECEDGKNTVNFIEHAQIKINIDHSHRGDLSIEVYSPSGTHSLILHPRDEDDSSLGFSNWTMTSVHFWGENPRGLWRVKFRDNGGIFSKNIGIIKFCYLIIHGTETMTFYERFYIRNLKTMKREAIRKKDNNKKYLPFSKKPVVPVLYNQDEFVKNYLNYLSLVHYQNYIENYAKSINLFESPKLEYYPTAILPFGYNLR